MNVAKASFWSSAIVLLFGYGVAVGALHIFPYAWIRAGAESALLAYWNRQTLFGLLPPERLAPAQYAGNGVTKFNAAEASPGLTLMSSFFDGGNEVRLIRLDGSLVHRWPLRFFDIFPRHDHIAWQDVPVSDSHVATHGVLALPDGSIVFNFDYLGAAKLDRCGGVVWTIPRIAHHSVSVSNDGGFWFASLKYLADVAPVPLLKMPVDEQSRAWSIANRPGVDVILKVSADGRIIREIPLLDVFFKNHLEALLLANGLSAANVASNDVTHLNDVEELSSAMSPAFPQFKAGDLLLSMRSLNLLMVIDPETERVKWHQTGPWIRQHDPDFLPTGRIAVFNNNDDGTEDGHVLGGSTIMEVDPATGQTTIRYGGGPNERMFNSVRGKEEYLENGNVLITQTEGGRVFEANAGGDVVWEFVNRYDATRVAKITSAHRYADGYFTVKDWSCR